MPEGMACLLTMGGLVSRETVKVRLLGPVDVTVDGVARPIPGLRRKSVLAVLALHPGEMVSARRLIDAVWSGDPPATVTNSLQGHIAYLRRALGAPDAIAARSSGYRLNLPVEAVDVGHATRLIASTARGGDHAGTAAQLTAALQLWRGPSLADVAEVTWLRDQGRRLDETRLETIERLRARRRPGVRGTQHRLVPPPARQARRRAGLLSRGA